MRFLGCNVYVEGGAVGLDGLWWTDWLGGVVSGLTM
jgi:hypothetical protein